MSRQNLYIKTTSLSSSLLSFIHFSRCCSSKTGSCLSLWRGRCCFSTSLWVCSLFYLIVTYFFAENTLFFSIFFFVFGCWENMAKPDKFRFLCISFIICYCSILIICDNVYQYHFKGCAFFLFLCLFVIFQLKWFLGFLTSFIIIVIWNNGACICINIASWTCVLWFVAIEWGAVMWVLVCCLVYLLW